MAENEIQRQRNEHKDDTSGPKKDDGAAADAKQPVQPKSEGGQQGDGGATTH